MYRAANSSSVVTLSVQRVSLSQVEPLVQNATSVPGLGHQAVCGTRGGSELYLALGSSSVLNVSAPCDVATQFAAKAVPRLIGA
jgi:hypothetical protein